MNLLRKLIIVLAALFIAQGAWAQNYQLWDGSTTTKPQFYSSYGGYANVVVINTGAELAYVRDNWTSNSGYWGDKPYFQLRYLLNADLDISAVSWIPMGNDNEFIIAFEGTFFGNAHTIRIKIENAIYNYQGLFARIAEEGTVQSLHLTGSIHCTDSRLVGGIAGENCGMIKNCWVSARVASDWHNSSSSYTAKVGGIVGENTEPTGYGTAGHVINCCVTNDVVNDDKDVGGIVGYNARLAAVKHCTFYGAVIGEHAGDQDNKWIGDDDGTSENLHDHDLDNDATLSSYLSSVSTTYSLYRHAIQYPYTVTIVNIGNGAVEADAPGFRYGKTVTLNVAYGGTPTSITGESVGSGNETVSGNPTDGYTFNTQHKDITITAVFPQSAWQNHAGTQADPYLISSATDWDEFANSVNHGTTYIGKFVKLNDNISVTTVAGTSETNSFSGTFLGNNKTLTANLSNTVSDYQGVAPFRYINSATIKDLTVAGTIASASYHTSGLVGFASGTNLIEDCTVTATLNISNDYAGGFLGHGGKSMVTFKDCVFAGTINGGSTNRKNIGVFWGWSTDGYPKLQNCLENGTYIRVSSMNPMGLNQFTGSITNCYYVTPQIGGPNYYNMVSGSWQVSASPDNRVYTLQQITAADGNQYYPLCMVSGINASYDLTLDGISITPTLQDINGNTLALGTDYTATLDSNDVTSLPISINSRGNYTLILTGTGSYGGSHSFAITVNFPVSGAGTEDDPFLISNATEWNGFANGVTNGTTYSGKFVKLTADISVTTMAGASDANSFQGTFDGDGHTLTLNMSDFTEQYLAPFRYVGNATIKNLKTAGTRSTSGQYAGGLIANIVNGSTVSIEGCVSSVTISSTSYTNSGFVSRLGDNSHLTIRGCAFVGSLEGSESRNNAGFVGYCQSGSTATIEDCLFAPDHISTGLANCQTFVRGDAIWLINHCYYTQAYGTAQGNPVQVASEGYLGNLLHDYGMVKAYYYGIFYNGTAYFAVADIAGTGTENDPYIISSTADWNTFAYYVNNGTKNYSSEYVKLNYDITVTMMVGTSEANSFQGTFLGNNKTLTANITNTNSGEAYRGVAPFHTISGATIRDLTVAGTIASNSRHTSGLVGYSYGTGNLIENCVVTATLNISENYTGGVIGHGGTATVTINSCAFIGTVNGVDGNRRYVGGIWGWSTDATPILNNCLENGTYNEIGYKDPIGYQRGSGSVTDCYYVHPKNVNSSWNYNNTHPAQQVITAIPDNEIVRLLRLADGNDYYIANTTVTGVNESYDLDDGLVSITPTVTVGGETDLVLNTDYTATLDGNDITEWPITFTTRGNHTLVISGYHVPGSNGYGGSKTLQFSVVGTYDGAGTETYPYLITSTDEWSAFAQNTTNGNAYSGTFFKLTNNISVTTMAGGTFSGTFDGDSHTITASISGTGSMALFNRLNGGTIKNLTVAGGISGGQHTAALLVSLSNDGTNLVENCVVTATVTSSGTHMGGFLAHGNSSNITIRGCVFNGMMTGGSTAKGVFYGWGSSTASVTDCLFLMADGQSTDGLDLVKGNGNFTVTNCYKNTSECSYGTEAIATTLASPNLGSQVQDYGMVTAYEHGILHDGMYYVDFATFNMDEVSLHTQSGQSEWTALTAGSTTGQTIGSAGNTTYYYASGNLSFTNSNAGGSGLTIRGTVYLYIPTGMTITCTGANADGRIGGGAGVELTAGNTLYLLGGGTLNATGGNGANGTNGAGGVDASGIYGMDTRPGSGGNGGTGGGGAGAGIGTGGGTGGGHGYRGVNDNIYQNHPSYNTGNRRHNGVDGNPAENGFTADAMGTLYVYQATGTTVNATGGNAGSPGSGGGRGHGRIDDDDYNYSVSGGGGGGAGGFGGAACNIGTGGPGGGGGGGGAAGAVDYKSSGFYDVTSYGGKGGQNGDGSYAADGAEALTSYLAYQAGWVNSNYEWSSGAANPPSGEVTFGNGGNGGACGSASVCGSAINVELGWPTQGAGTEADPYLISSTDDWNDFANSVNHGYTFSGKYMKLTNDISVTTMAGVSETNSFQGTFLGNNKTLTVNYNTTEQYTAPFRYVKNATIRDLKVAGDIYTSQKFAAGLVCSSYGETNIIDCPVSTVIYSSVNGDGTHGGLVALPNGGTTLNISGCVYTGRLLTNNDTNKCGGFVGWHGDATIRVTNSLYAPSGSIPEGWSAINNGATFVRGGSPTIYNCYYTETMGTAQGKLVYTTSTTLPENLGNLVQDYGMVTVYTNCILYNGTYYMTISLDGLGTEDNPYIIANADDWGIFTNNNVNIGNNYSGEFVRLDADIEVTTKCGIVSGSTQVNPFCGNFNGNGHTITATITDNVNEGTALFSYINGATIKNLTVAGTITSSQRHAAALVGFSQGTGNSIENCVVSANVSGQEYVGGILGHALSSEISINGCVYSGLMTGGGECTRAFIGWGDGGTRTVTNSLYLMADGQDTSKLDLVKDGGNLTVNNCYKTTSAGSNGKQAHTVTAGEYVTIENASLVGDITATYNVSGITAYAIGLKYNGMLVAGNGDEVLLTLSNTAAGQPGYGENHGYTASAGTLEGTENPYTLTMPDEDVTINIDIDVIDYETVNTGDENDPYLIYNNGQFNLLAQRVNDGTRTYSGKFFKLMNDISVTTMVGGSETNSFQGSFDGDNNKLTVNYNTSSEYTAPFRFVKNAVIENLHVDGTIATSAKFAGGIVAMSYGTLSITNCISEVTINSSITGNNHDGSHGGFVARINGDGNVTTISGCVFKGTFATTTNTNNCGGFIGWSDNKKPTITGSLMMPAGVASGMIEKTFARYHDTYNPTITDSYYVAIDNLPTNQGLQAYTTAPDNEISKKITVADITVYSLACTVSGVEASYNLYDNPVNITPVVTDPYDASLVFGTDYTATLNGVPMESLPISITNEGNHTLILTGTGNYQGTKTFAITVTNIFDGTGTEDDPYIINTTNQWNLFVNNVNNGDTYYGEFLKLTDDIEIRTMAGLNHVKSFQGTFDGNSHKLTFMKGTSLDPFADTENPYCAPFRHVRNAVIKNLHVDGTIYTSVQKAAGFVGESHQDLSIINCRSSVNINASVGGDGTHGGFVATLSGANNVITIDGCVFDGSFATTNNTTNCGGFIGWPVYNIPTITNSLMKPSSLDPGMLINTFARWHSTYETTISNCYFVATGNMPDNQGKQVHSITGDMSVTVANAGTATEYNVSGITSYGTGIKYNDVLYAGEGENVSLNLSCSAAQTVAGYNVNAGMLSGTENPYTLLMPDVDVIVSATFVEVTAYTLVTDVNQIVSGKHYIIASGKAGSVRVMAEQNTNNRTSVAATATNNVIPETDGVYEFVINGPVVISATDYYTIYDTNEASTGYLYAAGGNFNEYLKTQTTNDNKGQWTIAIDAVTYEATIRANESGNNLMQYDASSSIFSCYSGVQDGLYLYVKVDDNDLEYYGTEITYSGNTIPEGGSITVGAGSVLTLPDEFNNSDPNALVIQEGGQVIYNGTGSFNATLQENITGYGNNPAVSDGWYFIASPVDGLPTSAITSGAYDLFIYNEPNAYWYSNTGAAAPFNTLSCGQGYLYANSENTTLNIAGAMISTETQITKDLSFECDAYPELKGYNLMGNPFTRNLGTGDITIGGEPVTSVLLLNNDEDYQTCNFLASGVIKPGQGFFIQATGAGQQLVFNPSSKNVDEIGLISIEGGNEDYIDKAYIQIGGGNTLRKMTFSGEKSSVYVIDNGDDYAATTIYELEGTMPVNFKANKDGEYTITVNTTYIEPSVLILFDDFTGTEYDLLESPTYHFKSSVDDPDNRFKLIFDFNHNYNGVDDNYTNGNFAYQSGDEIIVSGNGELKVYDVLGRMVMNQRINGVQRVSKPSQKGVYILQLGGMTQKIVIR